MTCDEVRNRLLAATTSERDPDLGRHVETCPNCARFEQRLRAFKATLSSHHARHEPDATFAARVTASLPSEASLQLGRAALQLLPAAAVVLALLFWFALGAERDAASPAPVPTDDVVSWVLERADEPAGDGR